MKKINFSFLLILWVLFIQETKPEKPIYQKDFKKLFHKLISVFTDNVKKSYMTTISPNSIIEHINKVQLDQTQEIIREICRILFIPLALLPVEQQKLCIERIGLKSDLHDKIVALINFLVIYFRITISEKIVDYLKRIQEGKNLDEESYTNLFLSYYVWKNEDFFLDPSSFLAKIQIGEEVKNMDEFLNTTIEAADLPKIETYSLFSKNSSNSTKSQIEKLFIEISDRQLFQEYIKMMSAENFNIFLNFFNLELEDYRKQINEQKILKSKAERDPGKPLEIPWKEKIGRWLSHKKHFIMQKFEDFRKRWAIKENEQISRKQKQQKIRNLGFTLAALGTVLSMRAAAKTKK